MKSIVSILALAVAFVSASFVSASFAEDKAARPGGYNEQVANKKSLASCVANIAVHDSYGNVIGRTCH